MDGISSTLYRCQQDSDNLYAFKGQNGLLAMLVFNIAQKRFRETFLFHRSDSGYLYHFASRKSRVVVGMYDISLHCLKEQSLSFREWKKFRFKLSSPKKDEEILAWLFDQRDLPAITAASSDSASLPIFRRVYLHAFSKYCGFSIQEISSFQKERLTIAIVQNNFERFMHTNNSQIAKQALLIIKPLIKYNPHFDQLIQLTEKKIEFLERQKLEAILQKLKQLPTPSRLINNAGTDARILFPYNTFLNKLNRCIVHPFFSIKAAYGSTQGNWIGSKGVKSSLNLLSYGLRLVTGKNFPPLTSSHAGKMTIKIDEAVLDIPFDTQNENYEKFGAILREHQTLFAQTLETSPLEPQMILKILEGLACVKIDQREIVMIHPDSPFIKQFYGK